MQSRTCKKPQELENREKYKDINGVKERKEYPMSQLPGGGQTPQSTTLHVLLLTAGYRSSTEASSVCRRAIYYHNSNIPPIYN